MKNLIQLVGSIILVAVFIPVYIGTYHAHDYSMEIRPPEVVPESIYDVEYVEIVPNITEIPEFEKIPVEYEEDFLNLTFEEMDLLERIAMSEARGEGVKGMALVMNVVLNRSEAWQMEIHDVIYATGQFYTAGMCDPSEECHEALALVMDGWDESQGALFFNKYGYRYGKEPLFQYGAHYFSK